MEEAWVRAINAKRECPGLIERVKRHPCDCVHLGWFLDAIMIARRPAITASQTRSLLNMWKLELEMHCDGTCRCDRKPLAHCVMAWYDGSAHPDGEWASGRYHQDVVDTLDAVNMFLEELPPWWVVAPG